MTLPALPSSQQWADRCAADGEFRVAAKHWSGGLTLRIGDDALSLGVEGGHPGASVHQDNFVTYSAPKAVWAKILSPVPERFHNDLIANASAGAGVRLSGPRLDQSQYYSAVARAVELLRPSAESAGVRTAECPGEGVVEAAVGRYVHLELDGVDHRIYFETAGHGIPLLLQHTAGCHASQWRHLFEQPAITDRFQLVAYDLPFHGKSLPPVGRDWWQESYVLSGEFLRSIPIKLARALKLERPAFMGCSVGGLLALDLAHKHPDTFRAVVAVEGALRIPGKRSHMSALAHPQIGNQYKARLMEGQVSPTSPVAYRKETAFLYASGAPDVFFGDLNYYVEEFDLRDGASSIDTSRIPVHLLSGEYDYSATSELGREAHEAIAGSTWREMPGVGHFPMSENPDVFLEYLMPILEEIVSQSTS